MSLDMIYGFVFLFFLVVVAIEVSMAKERKKNKEIWDRIFKEEYKAPDQRPEDLER